MKDFDEEGEMTNCHGTEAAIPRLWFRANEGFFLCLLDWNCVYSNEISSTMLDYSKPWSNVTPFMFMV